LSFLYLNIYDACYLIKIFELSLVDSLGSNLFTYC